MNAFIKNSKSLTIAFENGEHFTVHSEHEFYATLLNAIRNKNYDLAYSICTLCLNPETFSSIISSFLSSVDEEISNLSNKTQKQRIALFNKNNEQIVATYDTIEEAHQRTAFSVENIQAALNGANVHERYSWKWIGDPNQNISLDLDDLYMNELQDDYEENRFPGMA